MKKIITGIFFTIATLHAIAQANEILVRHDTTLLKASECKWLIKSLAKNDSSRTANTARSVPDVILGAIEKGTIKAIDPETGGSIPAKQIYKWRIAADTIAQYDLEGNFKKNVTVQKLHNSNDIDQIRIFVDWYLNIATGKFRSVIKWIELLEQVNTSTGLFLGYRAFCRINY